MTPFDEFNAMHAELFNQFAELGTLLHGTDPARDVRMVVDDGAQTVGSHGEIIGNKRVISVLKSEWQPVRGDTLTVRGQTRKIEAIATDDGYLVQAVLHG